MKCKKCGGESKHVGWELDRCVPDYKPIVGQRIFVDMTKERAREIALEIIKKSGSWFSYGETKLGQGRESVKTILEDNPELMEEIENKIIEKLK